jgi:hypothetical protein
MGKAPASEAAATQERVRPAGCRLLFCDDEDFAERLVETIRTIAWMKEKARGARQEQRIIGLVPTMGALHAGHLALVERARQECSPVYVSIFLNPKQFSANEDLSRYPRPLERDIAKLEGARVDGLFLPDAVEIYPPGFATYVHVEGVSDRLEGRSRPGHFRGVTTVVLKLLEIVQPHYAYFGRKDAQQAGLVQRMVRDLNALPKCAGTGWAGDVVAECLFDGGRTASGDGFIQGAEGGRRAASLWCAGYGEAAEGHAQRAG